MILLESFEESLPPIGLSDDLVVDLNRPIGDSEATIQGALPLLCLVWLQLALCTPASLRATAALVEILTC